MGFYFLRSPYYIWPMRLLLLSNSTLPGQPFLGWPKEHITNFFKDLNGQILFVPYAGVSIDYDRYSELVIRAFKNMGLDMVSIHNQADKVKAVEEAAAIAVGGGNTFHLMKEMYDEGIVEAIRKAVRGGVPYVGWSAGSNVACPSIKTTNDMPIVEPPTFEALDLVDFQINPHYTEKTIEGHGGESRDQRIAEFLVVNKDINVVGLPEATLLMVDGDRTTLVGGTAKLFRAGEETRELPEGEVTF